MALSFWTTYDAIRGVLGISNEELPDETLALPMYEVNLKEVFLDIASDFVTTVTAAKAAVTGGTATAVQSRLTDLVELTAPYIVARQLCDALPNLAPRLISDGKASMNRHDQSYKDLVDSVKVSTASYLKKLSDFYAAEVKSSASATATVTLFSVSSPTVDVITGA